MCTYIVDYIIFTTDISNPMSNLTFDLEQLLYEGIPATISNMCLTAHTLVVGVVAYVRPRSTFLHTTKRNRDDPYCTYYTRIHIYCTYLVTCLTYLGISKIPHAELLGGK